ncbi:MAG: nucleotidyltransferase family protein [Succinivibrionaceae bacterium]|nr:nucleotidyltransferase family protein [Succinivibrionaceae bacterium]
MKAMILAAGRGERLRPLTDTCPKPLIKVAGRPLITYHLERLRAAGITEVVVNSAWLHQCIEDFLGDGSAFGLSIRHSVEGEGGLETAGGIIKALPLLGPDPFLVVNGDTLLDVDYATLAQAGLGGRRALLFLVANPPHHPGGDFSVAPDGALCPGHDYTFSGAALYHPSLFAGQEVGRLALRPFFERWMAQGLVGARAIDAPWFDIGTVERLKRAEDYLAAKARG